MSGHKHPPLSRPAERANRLASIAALGEAAWIRVESLVTQRAPAAYSEAVGLLADPREIALDRHELDSFEGRLETLRVRHARKVSFMNWLAGSELSD